MEIIVGKLSNRQMAPFGQLLNMFSDAAEARLHYQQAQSISAGLLFVDNETVVGAVLYRNEGGHIVLVSTLAWKTVDRLTLFEQLMTYFSKHRVKSLQMKVAPNQANSPLLDGFERVDELTYRRTFSYPVALVLGGGGAHGAFEAGVFDVLKSRGIIPHEVLGVSVGSINAMSFMHLDSTISHATWDTLTTDVVYEVPEVGVSRVDFSKTVATHLVGRHYFEKESLRQLIYPVVAHELATPRLAEMTLVATELPLLRPASFSVTDETTADELTDWILASSAFYPVVSPVMINGKQYIDGGYSNNLPINIAADHGAKEIYAVSIMDGVPEDWTRPDDAVVHYIRTPWQFGPLLDFFPDLSGEYVTLGEIRTKQVLGELGGHYYALPADVDISWLGGVQLVKWLATDPVTAPIANALTELPVWLAWQQWLARDIDPDATGDEAGQGLATIERLARLLAVDKLQEYDLTTFVAAIVAAGRTNRQALPTPTHHLTRTYILANLDVVLTGVLYLLSKSEKTSRINK